MGCGQHFKNNALIQLAPDGSFESFVVPQHCADNVYYIGDLLDTYIENTQFLEDHEFEEYIFYPSTARSYFLDTHAKNQPFLPIYVLAYIPDTFYKTTDISHIVDLEATLSSPESTPAIPLPNY